MATSLIQNFDQRIIRPPNPPEVSSHPLQWRVFSYQQPMTRHGVARPQQKTLRAPVTSTDGRAADYTPVDHAAARTS